jgi:hypothetical protein
LFGGGVNETIKKDAATIVSQKAVIDASASANILKVATNLFIGFLGKKIKPIILVILDIYQNFRRFIKR